jgi:hypothetical protein
MEIAISEATGLGEFAHHFWLRQPWSLEAKKPFYLYDDYFGGEYPPI